MQFKINMIVLASALVTSATNLVTFVSMDSTDRTIVWTGNLTIAQTSVPGNQNVTVTLPYGYIGNAYSVSEGGNLSNPGMLAEFAWNAYAGATYFDVSAIVNPDDTQGVYQMYPSDTESPISGCLQFPCDNAYYNSDDIQTKSTASSEIIVTLGAGLINIPQPDLEGRKVKNFPHQYVEKRRSWSSSLEGRSTLAHRRANHKN